MRPAGRKRGGFIVRPRGSGATERPQRLPTRREPRGRAGRRAEGEPTRPPPKEGARRWESEERGGRGSGRSERSERGAREGERASGREEAPADERERERERRDARDRTRATSAKRERQRRGNHERGERGRRPEGERSACGESSEREETKAERAERERSTRAARATKGRTRCDTDGRGYPRRPQGRAEDGRASDPSALFRGRERSERPKVDYIGVSFSTLPQRNCSGYCNLPFAPYRNYPSNTLLGVYRWYRRAPLGGTLEHLQDAC